MLNRIRRLAILLLLGLLIAGGPVALHFAQIRHDVLPFDVDARFPVDATIAPGEVFATTLAALVDHELSSPAGWRPNDLFLWGPELSADNNSHRQLGVIQAIRECTRIFKDHLTKVSATQFDTNLVLADTAFRNDAKKFWLPSAESKFREGVRALEAYVAGLNASPPVSKQLNRRNVEAIRLMQGWTDLLGDAHANLFKQTEPDGHPVPPWRTDDYFYHAQGFAHVLHYLALAIRREYHVEIAARPTLATLFDEVAGALGVAARMKPLIVLDGGSASVFANHRRNLDAFIVEARQKMYSIREELEK